MAAKPIKSLELHYTMIQFLLTLYLFYNLILILNSRESLVLIMNLHLCNEPIGSSSMSRA